MCGFILSAYGRCYVTFVQNFLLRDFLSSILTNILQYSILQKDSILLYYSQIHLFVIVRGRITPYMLYTSLFIRLSYLLKNSCTNLQLSIILPTKMETVPKLKTFQQVQVYLASLGHRPNQSPFNKTQLWIFAKTFLNLFLLFVYLVRESHTPKELMDSMFMLTGVFLIAIIRVSTLFKNETIFMYIDRVEETINESKLNFVHLTFKSIYIFQKVNGISFRTETSGIKKAV